MADEIKNVEGEAAVQGNFIWDFKRILPRAENLRVKKFTPVFLPNRTAIFT